jgi:hypothetical protein
VEGGGGVGGAGGTLTGMISTMPCSVTSSACGPSCRVYTHTQVRHLEIPSDGVMEWTAYGMDRKALSTSSVLPCIHANITPSLGDSVVGPARTVVGIRMRREGGGDGAPRAEGRGGRMSSAGKQWRKGRGQTGFGLYGD